MYAPIGEPISAIQILEEITFDVPWGKNGAPIPMTVKEDGYLNITNLNHIYGIQKSAFENTYAKCNEKRICNERLFRTNKGLL